MKLTPNYPKKLFERSYKTGLIIGSMIGIGISIMILMSFWYGISILVLAILLYTMQNMD